MPYYDLRCEDCQHEFNVKATVAERSEGRLRCPACDSSRLATVFKRLNVLRYKDKDCDVCPAPMAGGGGCCGGACNHRH